MISRGPVSCLCVIFLLAVPTKLVFDELIGLTDWFYSIIFKVTNLDCLSLQHGDRQHVKTGRKH